MSLPIADCTETRIVDAVVKLFRDEDPDFSALCQGRVKVGSAAVAPLDASIVPRQMNVYAGQAEKDPDVGDAWDLVCDVQIEYFFPRNLLSTEDGWRQSMNECKAIVLKLYAGHHPRSPGRLNDPADTTKTITNMIRSTRTSEPRLMESSIVRFITITFQTRETSAGEKV